MFTLFILTLCVIILFGMTGCDKSKLSEMSEEGCIEFIKSKGVDIPEDFNDENLGAFVKKIITAVEKDPDIPFAYSYTVTLDFVENIRKIVNEYYNYD